MPVISLTNALAFERGLSRLLVSCSDSVFGGAFILYLEVPSVVGVVRNVF